MICCCLSICWYDNNEIIKEQITLQRQFHNVSERRDQESVQFYKRLSETAEMGFYLDWNWKENVTGSANANSLLVLLQCIIYY